MSTSYYFNKSKFHNGEWLATNILRRGNEAHCFNWIFKYSVGAVCLADNFERWHRAEDSGILYVQYKHDSIKQNVIKTWKFKPWKWSAEEKNNKKKKNYK